MWHGSTRTPEIAEQAAYYRDGFFADNIFWPKEHSIRLIGFYRQCYAYYSRGAEQQAIVGLGGQAYVARNSQDAKREIRPYFSDAPLYGHGYGSAGGTEVGIDLMKLAAGGPAA